MNDEILIELDSDGVLVDLDLHIKDVYGKRLSEMDDTEGLIMWRDHFTPEWFRHAKPMADYRVLLDYCLENFKNVGVLTALPYHRKDMAEESKATKIAWYADRRIEVPIKFGPYAIDKQKHCTGPKHVLIDDSVKNICQWQAAGGCAILHDNAKSSVEQLKQFAQSVKAR